MTNTQSSKRFATSLAAFAFVAISASAAHADATAVVAANSSAFAKAFMSCDVPAAVALYEDQAVLIWPIEGEVATGKDAIAKIIKADCSGAAKPSLKPVSSDAHAIGKDYIANVGMWDNVVPGPDGKPMVARVRTTELLHKSGGKWRYVIDHASIGTPPPGNPAPKAP